MPMVATEKPPRTLRLKDPLREKLEREKERRGREGNKERGRQWEGHQSTVGWPPWSLHS